MVAQTHGVGTPLENSISPFFHSPIYAGLRHRSPLHSEYRSPVASLPVSFDLLRYDNGCRTSCPEVQALPRALPSYSESSPVCRRLFPSLKPSKGQPMPVRKHFSCDLGMLYS